MAGNRLTYGLRGIGKGASLGSAIGGVLGGPVGATAGTILGGIGGFAANALTGGKGAGDRQEAKMLKADVADMRAGKLGLSGAEKEQLVGQATADIGRQTGAAQRQVSRDALVGGDPAAYARAQRGIAETAGAPIAQARASVNDLSRRIAEQKRAEIMKRMGIAVGDERAQRAANADNLVVAGKSIALGATGADPWLVDLLNSRGLRNATRSGTDPKARVDPTNRSSTTRAEYDAWANQGADTPTYDAGLDAMDMAAPAPAADPAAAPATTMKYRYRDPTDDALTSEWDPTAPIPGIGGSVF